MGKPTNDITSYKVIDMGPRKKMKELQEGAQNRKRQSNNSLCFEMLNFEATTPDLSIDPQTRFLNDLHSDSNAQWP